MACCYVKRNWPTLFVKGENKYPGIWRHSGATRVACKIVGSSAIRIDFPKTVCGCWKYCPPRFPKLVSSTGEFGAVVELGDKEIGRAYGRAEGSALVEQGGHGHALPEV